MKAVRVHHRGGPEQLRYEDAPRPEIGPHDVLVRVRACALNHLDLLVRDGPWSGVVSYPHIPGLETAGDIAEIGDAVDNVGVGDRVLVSPTLNCAKCEHCRRDEDNLCRRLTIFGLHINGGYAEYLKAPSTSLIALPPELSYEEAAATPVAFGTAWHMLVTRVGLKSQNVVLVLAAGSGVGSAALQIAKYFGCYVIATAGTDAKLEKAKALGADATLNYRSEDLRRAVLRLTDRRGVDVVVEHVGSDTWEKSLACLAPNGKLVTCGATTGRVGATDIRNLFIKQLTVIGSYGAARKDFLTVSQLVAERKLKPVIDRCFPLHEAARAQQYLADRQQFGKVILCPDQESIRSPAGNEFRDHIC
jgi:NADPH:quinone reductase-like Zn-dependent oxidoreductase